MVNWYITLSLTIPTYKGAMVARAIAKHPVYHIIYVTYNDSRAIVYGKMRLVLSLLLAMDVIELDAYLRAVDCLNQAVKPYAWLNTIIGALVFYDGATFYFDGI
jgi:hypothetical protein